MLFDPSGGLRQQAGDQAEGLRQLLKPETGAIAPASGSVRVLDWPRIVLISEYPGTDVGARFAYHLASTLGGCFDRQPSEPRLPSLLLDLAPAASRLPHVLADRLPADRYPPLWSELAAGRSLATLGIGGVAPLAVAAEYKLVPAVLDQLPRLYEQLVRQLSRSSTRFGWVVLLALDHIVPLDRACWQAADDIVLLGGVGAQGCHRQAAALRSRLSELEPGRSLWTLPKRRRTGWFRRPAASSLSAPWLETGLALKLLPAVSWPHEVADGQPSLAARADHLLHRSALRVAERLRSSSTSHATAVAKSA